MKTGWLGILAGAFFVALVSVSLVGARSGSVPESSAVSPQNGERPSDCTDAVDPSNGADTPERDQPDSHESPGVFDALTLFRDGDGHGVRGVRIGRTYAQRRVLPRDSNHRAYDEQRPARLVRPLERVVSEARCLTTTLRAEAPLLHAHAPPA